MARKPGSDQPYHDHDVKSQAEQARWLNSKVERVKNLGHDTTIDKLTQNPVGYPKTMSKAPPPASSTSGAASASMGNSRTRSPAFRQARTLTAGPIMRAAIRITAVTRAGAARARTTICNQPKTGRALSTVPRAALAGSRKPIRGNSCGTAEVSQWRSLLVGCRFAAG